MMLSLIDGRRISTICILGCQFLSVKKKNHTIRLVKFVSIITVTPHRFCRGTGKRRTRTKAEVGGA